MRSYIRPQSIDWWLNPIVIICLFHVPVAVASLLTPDYTYQILWQVPKYFTINTLLLTLSTSLFLTIGCLIGMKSSGNSVDTYKQSIGSSQLRVLILAFRLCFALALLGYVIFSIAAYTRGASLGLFVQILKGQNGAATELKRNYFQTLPGITTCTQFGIAAAILGVLVVRFSGDWKQVRIPFFILFMFSALRAIFLSERLALIEVLLPGLVLYLRVYSSELHNKQWKRALLRFSPIAAPILLYLFFAISESVRSWAYYSTASGGTLWQFAFGRLSGYYLTSMNNSAYFVNSWHYNSWIPGFTFDWLFKFPGLGALIAGGSDVLINRGVYIESLLSSGLNPEFNNPGGMLSPIIDLGVAGGLVFWLLSGFVLGRLYSLFRKGGIPGLLFYPIAIQSLMETPRFLYWTSGRAFPAILILILTLIILKDADRPEAAVPAYRLPPRLSAANYR